MNPLTLIESFDPTTLGLFIAATLFVAGVCAVALLSWPDPKPVVRTYRESHPASVHPFRRRRP